MAYPSTEPGPTTNRVRQAIRMSTQAKLDMDPGQRRRVRRSALLWGLIALGVYTAFIVRSVLRGIG
jgi:hypothetical protein